jgi:Mg2+-importing ATPase
VVVKNGADHVMITKGSVKNILEICSQVELSDNHMAPIADNLQSILKKLEEFGDQGFRTLGVCYKNMNSDRVITKDDENGMIFLGIVLLFDPPKAGVSESLKRLRESGVQVKLITGDNVRVAAYIGERIGLVSGECLTGSDLRQMTDEALSKKVESIEIFAEMEPYQKESIIKVLHKAGHAVAFLGDGINDASAMQAADVGISVDTAVDIARETADVVLLERNLDVLYDAIQEGRKTFGNTLKYIFITTSANFGNMFSVAGASVMLPFLPLLPKQILLINFLTDIPTMALSSDTVGKNFLTRPKHWNNALIKNFMIVFGLISAAFDILTFAVLRAVFHADAALFRTAWFVECILTEVLFVFIVRSHRPLHKSNPGRLLIAINAFVIVATFGIISSPLGRSMEFVAMPASILITVLVLVILFVLASEFAKQIFFRKQKWDLDY